MVDETEDEYEEKQSEENTYKEGGANEDDKETDEDAEEDNEKYKEDSELSKEVWRLKEKKVDFTIKWNLDYTPGIA